MLDLKSKEALVTFEVPNTDESIKIYFTMDGTDLDFDVKATELIKNSPMNEHLASMLAGMFISMLNGEGTDTSSYEPPTTKKIIS